MENCGTEGGEKMVKGFKTESASRKRLADISNVPQQSKPMNLNQHPALLVCNDNVDKLYKENMTLTKLVADRNKLIELSGIELQKLRVNFQKAQQQNVQLAQRNSHMLAELNSGKDKLRVIQHELCCKNSLLHARKFLKEDVPANNAQAVESSSIDVTNDQLYDGSRKGHSRRSYCLVDGRSAASIRSKNVKIDALELSVRNNEKDDDKRPARTRRQSMRFKAGEPRPTQDLFEIDEAKVPVSSLCNDQTDVICAISEGSALGKEGQGDNGTRFETQENQRSSTGRPMRRAAEKVASYKETPINAKMRREK